jgi:RNA recognition motif-containing protein
VMPARQEATAAITALQGQELKGHLLEVNEARPPSRQRGGQRGRSRDDRKQRGGRRY